MIAVAPGEIPDLGKRGPCAADSCGWPECRCYPDWPRTALPPQPATIWDIRKDWPEDGTNGG